MPFLSLPPELLAHIILYLRKRDIERLAQTYHRALTSLCIPALSPWRAVEKNKRDMTAIFGEPRLELVPDELDSCRDVFRGRPNELGAFSIQAGPEKSRRFDFLELNGDLHWLRPLDARVDQESRRVENELMTLGKLREMESACTDLGLTLPSSFARVMTDGELRRRFPLTSGSPLKCCLPFVKVRPGQKIKEGGYLMQFEEDGAHWHTYLFLSPGGGHCVLVAEYNFESLGASVSSTETFTRVEEKLGIKNSIPDDDRILYAEGADFEAFLVPRYFETWASFFTDDHRVKLPEWLKEYLIRVYSKEGRK